MGLAQIRPGEYTMTYDGTAIGMCRSDGKSLRYRRKGKPINDTDTFGLTKIDGIALGCDVFLALTMIEWNAGVKKAIWPQSTTFDGTLGVIGRIDSDLAKAIVLTAVAGTPAATLGPATLTASKGILAPENDVNIIFGPDETPIPLLFELLPYDDSGTKRHFSLT